MLDILVQRRRDKKAAKRFFRKLLQGLTYVLPRCLRPDRVARPPAASPALGSCIPSGDATTLPNLAGDYRLGHGCIRAEHRSPRLSFYLEITSRRINLTTLTGLLSANRNAWSSPLPDRDKSSPRPPWD
jgi:transposase-like protein